MRIFSSRRFALFSALSWQRPDLQLLIKSVATLIILTFVFPSVAWAFEPSTFQAAFQGVSFNQKPVELPSQWGTITDSYQGQEQLVIHIQDLHCNQEIQKNIARMIDWFAGRHGLRLVGIEGASLPVNVTKLSTFPDASAKTEAADFFVKEGKLSGGEYYAVLGRHPIDLVGVEQREHYQQEKSCVLEFLSEESEGLLNDLRDALSALKPALYNSNLKNLDARKTKYLQGKIEILAYAGGLAQAAGKHGVTLEPYPEVRALLAGQRSVFDPEVDYDRLLSELEELDTTVRATLYTQERQQQLDAFLRQLDATEKLINISATPEDLARFRQQPEAFKVAPVVRFIAAHGGPEVESEVFALEKHLRAVRRFYDIADQRSADFVQNLLRHMAQRKTRIAVLTTGGYHTGEILQNLRSRGVSYISIRPRMTRTDVLNPYFALLRNQKTPLEKLLAQNQQKFALAPMFMEWLDAQAILNEKEMPSENQVVYQAVQITLLMLWLKNLSGQKALTQQELLQAHDVLQANYPAYDSTIA